MDKVRKFLKRLPKKDLQRVLLIINKLGRKNIEGLDVKKLSGHGDIFRVRSGNMRMLFLRTKEGYRVISIERRSDTTYDL